MTIRIIPLIDMLHFIIQENNARIHHEQFLICYIFCILFHKSMQYYFFYYILVHVKFYY